MKARFRELCAEAVKNIPGVESVEITMAARASSVQEQPSDALDGVNSVLAVSSCKGGVGKSTIAAHLARAMQRNGLAVALLDADVYGPSVPTLFGLQHIPGVQVQNNRMLPVDAEGLKVMSLGFLLGDAPAVLRGPLVSSYITQVIQQTAWGKLDYLIIDMPPGTGDIQLTIVQKMRLDGAIIVTTPQTLSLVDVARGILMFEKVNVPVLGVVENMTAFTCPSCGETHYPFGRGSQSLQKRFGLPTLAELPVQPGLSEMGKTPDPESQKILDHLADQVLRHAGMSRVKGNPRPEVTISDRAVQVRWPDGFEAVFDTHYLRCACPCAQCVDEHTGEQILKASEVPRDIVIKEYNPLGNYAIVFTWSDGHSTGIYAWEYLRELARKKEETS